MRLSSCTEWLFFHLWKKNPETNQSSPGILIPDTIIYRWAKPHFWYFSNKQGEIIRKTKEKIVNEQVNEEFNLSQSNQSAILANYISSNSTSTLKYEKNKQNKQIERVMTLQETINFEYLNKNNWQNFLFLREKEVEGVLQKFVQPKDGHNQLIKVTWSPQFRLLERKTNIHQINDQKIEISERVSTYEGPQYLLVQDSVLSPIISHDIEQICLNIVKHIQEITVNNVYIQKMVIYFKQDDKNRLWLLFCTSLKLKEMTLWNANTRIRVESPIMRMKQQMKQVTGVKGNIDTENGQVANLLNNFEVHCSNCEKLYPNLLEISFKNIVDSFEQKTISNEDTVLPQEIVVLQKKQEQRESKKAPIKKDQQYISKEEELQDLLLFVEEQENQAVCDFKNVPALITKVWGTVSKQKFQMLKSNPSWLNYKTKVCDDCFLKFTQVSLESRMMRNVRKQQNNMKNLSNQNQYDIFNISHDSDTNQIAPNSGKGKQNQNDFIQQNNKKKNKPLPFYSPKSQKYASNKNKLFQSKNLLTSNNNQTILQSNQNLIHNENIIQKTTNNNFQTHQNEAILQDLSHVQPPKSKQKNYIATQKQTYLHSTRETTDAQCNSQRDLSDFLKARQQSKTLNDILEQKPLQTHQNYLQIQQDQQVPTISKTLRSSSNDQQQMQSLNTFNQPYTSFSNKELQNKSPPSNFKDANQNNYQGFIKNMFRTNSMPLNTFLNQNHKLPMTSQSFKNSKVIYKTNKIYQDQQGINHFKFPQLQKVLNISQFKKVKPSMTSNTSNSKISTNSVHSSVATNKINHDFLMTTISGIKNVMKDLGEINYLGSDYQK